MRNSIVNFGNTEVDSHRANSKRTENMRPQKRLHMEAQAIALNCPDVNALVSNSRGIATHDNTRVFRLKREVLAPYGWLLSALCKLKDTNVTCCMIQDRQTCS